MSRHRERGTKSVAQMETLEAVGTLSLLPHHFQYGVDEVDTFTVVALGQCFQQAVPYERCPWYLIHHVRDRHVE